MSLTEGAGVAALVRNRNRNDAGIGAGAAAAAKGSTTNTWEPSEFIHNYSKNIVKRNITVRNRKHNTRNINALSTIATAGKSIVVKKKLPVVLSTKTSTIWELRHALWDVLDVITEKDIIATIYRTLLSRPRNPDKMTLIEMRHAIKHKINQLLGEPYIFKSDLDNIKREIFRWS